MLKYPGQYGLEVGKDANFIVLDGIVLLIGNRAKVLVNCKGEYLFKPIEYEVELDLV